MPTIRLFLLITGNLRTLSSSMCVSPWRGYRPPGSNECLGSSHHAPSRGGHRNCPRPSLCRRCRGPVTMPISWSFSPMGIAPMSCLRINFASSMTGVSGPAHSTPLCIATWTFAEDLSCCRDLETSPPSMCLSSSALVFSSLASFWPRSGAERRARPILRLAFACHDGLLFPCWFLIYGTNACCRDLFFPGSRSVS